MHLNSITLINYGVFRGKHTIDLRTKAERPIILFGGKNGAGKSTLLEAVCLCLYGQLAAGTKASKDQYASYLEQRIHSSASLLVQPTFSSVSIEFSYADLGRLHVYEVTRSWGRKTGGRTAERLDVKRDGTSLGELGSEQWQDFVRELIPPGVSSLFFFDGEKIQHLAEDSTDQVELAHSIKALLGVHLIERLQADLSIYQGRLAKENGHAASDAELERLNQEVQEAERELSARRAKHQELDAKLKEHRDRLGQIEQSITAEGGGFAKRRDALVKRREEARAAVTSLEAGIRQLCAGLLPFAFAPQILRSLRDQLRTEQRLQAHAAGEAMVAAIKSRFSELLDADATLAKKPSVKIRRRVLELLDGAIAAVGGTVPEAGGRAIHALSPSATQQLLHWIDQSLADIPRSAHGLGADLEMQYRDLQRTEEELKKVPADEVLQPLLEQLNMANQQIGDTTRQLLISQEQLAAAEAKVAGAQKRLKAELDRLNLQAATHSRLRLLPKIQTALGDFTNGLIVDRVAQLERELTYCFNLLSRKTDAVKRVSISPVDFSVTLYDKSDAPLPKQALSAGEKQIYAIAVLWGLARVSKRPLPLIIDTPLGRLDSDHRRLLVEDYFPAASHQVILLSTDTEVDHVYFEALRPYVTKAYRLEFDMTERCTNIASGYFEAVAK